MFFEIPFFSVMMVFRSSLGGHKDLMQGVNTSLATRRSSFVSRQFCPESEIMATAKRRAEWYAASLMKTSSMTVILLRNAIILCCGVIFSAHLRLKVE
jgi:hypothetical protein